MTRYNDSDVQSIFDYACEYVCDYVAAMIICDSLNGYGSPYIMVSADEWDNDTYLHADYYCVIGEDASLDYYVITLK